MVTASTIRIPYTLLGTVLGEGTDRADVFGKVLRDFEAKGRNMRARLRTLAEADESGRGDRTLWWLES